MRWTVQIAALVGLVAVFALQIPKSAIFFRPVATKESAPCAAFVTLDDAAYARLIRKVRAVNWPGSARGWKGGTMSLGTESFVLDDSPHPAPGLPLPADFTDSRMSVDVRLRQLKPSLQPASLAMPLLPPIPAGSVPPVEKKRLDALLDIDSFESLKERK